MSEIDLDKYEREELCEDILDEIGEPIIPDGWGINVTLRDSDRVVEKVSPGSIAFQALEVIAEHNIQGDQPTAPEIVDETGESASSVRPYLTFMAEGGLIHRFRPTEQGNQRHQITEKGRNELRRAQP